MFNKKLSTDELNHLKGMERIIRTQQYLLKLVSGNTYAVRGGQKYRDTQEDIVALLIQERENFIHTCASKRGFTKAVSVDLASGKIWEKE